MSISSWFKRFLSPPSRTDASAGVANETDDEKTITEARLDVGAGSGTGSGTQTAAYGGQAAGQVVEGELSEYDAPTDSDA